jgi:peptide chain release factor 3
MAVERERGISVSSAVMSFEHEGPAFNLLDTFCRCPGAK